MSIFKAFLSHSSEDKELVKAVAQDLGRQYSIYDEKVFKTGDEFKKSIEDGLDASSIFVLFASKDSLLSDWVNFEIEEAWYRKLEKNVRKSLVYIINDSVTIDEIPKWLRRAKIQNNNVPKTIAREIRNHLDQLGQERKNPFIGRSEDIEALERALTPADILYPPHVFFVTGLPGVGRRSLINRVVKSSLDLEPIKHPFRLGTGFSLQDICSSVADLSEPYATDLRFRQIIQEIQGLSKENALIRTLGNLRKITLNGELPIFLDEGGLFDSDGNISEPVQLIIQSLLPNDDAYIAIVSSRRPSIEDKSIAKVKLAPLKEKEQKLLIKTLDNKFIRTSGKRKEPLNHEEISELAEYTAGFPPSAYAAMEVVAEYGIAMALTNKAKFVQNRTNQFLQQFSRTNISEVEKSILCLLGSYSPLPLTVIISTITKGEIEIENIIKCMERLIDLSFIVVEDRLYRIADPIADAAIKAFKIPEMEVMELLAKSILKLIDDPNFEEQRLELHRILYRVSWFIKDRTISDKVVFLFNDLIKTIETLFNANNRNDYSKILKLTKIALTQCKLASDYAEILSYRARVFIKQEKWEEAQQEIDKYKDYALIQNFYYLQGFLYKRYGKHKEAIDSYLKSSRYGRKGESLQRELGHSYFLIGDYATANEYVEKVLDRQRKKNRLNFYAVDLQIQIATALKNKDLALSCIEQLKDINEIAYYFRKSRFEFYFVSDKIQAENDAIKALDLSEGDPRFHILSHLAFCKIANGKTSDAEDLIKDLDQKFPSNHQDIRKGLRARLAISQKSYEDALSLSDEITDKSSKIYKGIRRDMLQGYLNGNYNILDIDRTSLEIELTKIKEEFLGIKDIEFAIGIELTTENHSELSFD